MPAITTHGLTRRFWRTTAVDRLDLEIPAGSVNVLLGANGAGKTTTLKLLLNLLSPTAGTATVLGVPSARLNPATFQRIGYVSESMRQPDGLTVRSLLDTWRPLYPRWDRELETRLLRDFDLPPDRKLKHLSRGMAMKANLLSVLPYRPELLILDEPFSGLDVLTRDQVVQGILELVSAEGCTVLVSSHEITEVETLADRLLWLDRGRLALAEDADALRTRFRRVTVTGSAPAHAWDVQSQNGLTTYVDSHFEAASTPATAAVTPLTLREIFIALLKHRQSGSSTAPVHA